MLPEPRRAASREMRLHGAVVEADLPRLSEYLDEVVAEGPERVVVDLSTCPSLHDDAVILLVAAQNQLRASGAAIELRATPDVVREQLRAAGVEALFAHAPAKLATVLPIR